MSTSKSTMYLETNSTDPAYNLAFEETVLRNRQDRPYLLLWQNDNTIVVGQNQNTAAESGVQPAAAQFTTIWGI